MLITLSFYLFIYFTYKLRASPGGFASVQVHLLDVSNSQLFSFGCVQGESLGVPRRVACHVPILHFLLLVTFGPAQGVIVVFPRIFLGGFIYIYISGI